MNLYPSFYKLLTTNYQLFLFFRYDSEKSLRQPFGGKFKLVFRGDHFQEFIEFLKRQGAMSFLASGQFHLDADFVAVAQEFFNLAGTHLEIVLAGSKADAHSLKLNFFLLFAMFAFALFLLVFELAEVHDLAYGGLGGGGYLD